MRRLAIGVVLAVLLGPGPGPGISGAQPAARRGLGGLAPSAPSQLVHLRPPVGPPPGCAGSPSSLPVDQRVLPDGSVEPFSVPVGQVLVLTSANWLLNVSGSPPAIVQLSLAAPGGSLRPFVLEIHTVTAGLLSGRAILGDVVMRPGDSICLSTNQSNGGGTGAVFGFLTADE